MKRKDKRTSTLKNQPHVRTFGTSSSSWLIAIIARVLPHYSHAYRVEIVIRLRINVYCYCQWVREPGIIELTLPQPQCRLIVKSYQGSGFGKEEYSVNIVLCTRGLTWSQPPRLGTTATQLFWNFQGQSRQEVLSIGIPSSKLDQSLWLY